MLKIPVEVKKGCPTTNKDAKKTACKNVEVLMGFRNRIVTKTRKIKQVLVFQMFLKKTKNLSYRRVIKIIKINRF